MNENQQQVKILLAEDDPINQETLLDQLDMIGYQADAASDGQEVVDAHEKNSYDIILLDCIMPKLTGYEAAKMIREKEGAQRKVIIIAMTAHSGEKEKQKCLDAGMDDFLSKPFKKADIQAMLEKWIKG